MKKFFLVETLAFQLLMSYMNFISNFFPFDVLIQTVYSLPQESGVSAVTSIYSVSRLLQVVGGRSMINNVACVILYHFLNLNVRVLNEGNASNGHDDVKPFSKCLSEVERIICYAPESNEAESIMSSFNNEEICSKRLVFLSYFVLAFDMLIPL